MQFVKCTSVRKTAGQESGLLLAGFEQFRGRIYDMEAVDMA